MKTAQLMTLPIADVKLDIENPRIKQFLDIYQGKITAQHIALALSDSSNNDTSTTYRSLKESIRASKGIIHPIVVNKEADGTYTVIEGNTRLQIYKDFAKKEPNGVWDNIIALVYDQLDTEEKHKIRLQSHLVGPREWDPYSKAKYLWQLYVVEAMPMAQIIDMCGGKKNEINKQIEAYIYMEEFYRPYVATKPNLFFDTRNFSKFLEYQNGSINRAIAQKGFSEEQFAKWVADDNVDKALKVRLIPAIMNDDEALNVFLTKNLTEAEKVLNAHALVNDDLSKYPYEVLCKALNDKLMNFDHMEVVNLANNPAYSEKKYILESTESMLKFYIDEVKQRED